LRPVFEKHPLKAVEVLEGSARPPQSSLVFKGHIGPLRRVCDVFSAARFLRRVGQGASWSRPATLVGSRVSGHEFTRAERHEVCVRARL